MMRSYEYHGYTLEVTTETEFKTRASQPRPTDSGFVAVVRIFRAGATVAAFSPLRFGEVAGRPFATEADALMGGYSAARKIVDDLFGSDAN
ncbi:hypothetical protein [Paraburkholderia acidipaludis]|uniref:hypothetical protein n=1 Tax=Paraburkholderia acidipaludis TaxID=660537 RepID=UPI0004827732|nr:hypothetical protein [Paraburkholderia acidipaludis]